MLLIKNGLVHDAVNREPYIADILVEEGKIVKIEKDIEADAQVFDASGLEVYPGFVEAHCHTGLHGYGIGFEGADYNEMGDIVACHLRAIDAIEPRDETLVEA
ncbi:MAG: amidohydrolase, partial [Clostridia bacterium]|nr:amidohydrolase [Clostridia bacterium]